MEKQQKGALQIEKVLNISLNEILQSYSRILMSTTLMQTLEMFSRKKINFILLI